MSAIELLLNKLSEEERRAVAAELGIELAPPAQPQRNQAMRDFALSLGVEQAADPAVSDAAVLTCLKPKLAMLGLNLADATAPKANGKPSPKPKDEAKPAYQWAAPTTTRTKKLPEGGILHNWYQKGEEKWTWVRTTKSPSPNQVKALEDAGFVWSTRKAAWYAKRPVGLKTVQSLLS